MISSIPKWVSNTFGSSMRPNVQVLEVHDLSSNIKKVRFHGDILKWEFKIGYASVIRVSETEFRNYTIAYHDTKNGIFDIIFHIHGCAVGSEFANSLKENDEIFISPPRGKVLYDPNVEQQFFFGDETSLGLATSLLPVLKQNQQQFQFCFELDDENKNLPELLGLENITVFLKMDLIKREKWMSGLPIFPKFDGHTSNFILTGNAKSAKTFRTILKKKTTGKIAMKGYWIEGKKGL